jgi:DNA-binding MarR family transcriptional regulator
VNETELNQLYNAFRVIAQYMNIHSSSLKRRAGVTGPQLSVLIALKAHTQLSVSQVSRWVHLSTGTVSGTLARMEKKNLVLRRPSPDDRRKHLFELTTAGAIVLKRCANPFPPQFVNSMRTGMQEWEQQMVLSAVNKVADIMQQCR